MGEIVKTAAKSWVVTGGAGFIGSHIVKALVAAKQRVTVVDNFSSGFAENLIGVEKSIRLVQADICRLPELLDAFSGADFVLHHAALVSVPRSLEEPEATWQINVQGTANVLEAARRCRVKRVVFASSCSVYGSCLKPFRENSPLRSGSPYALSKQLGEELCRFYTQVYGLETVILRYFNVYGEGQNPHAPYSAVIAKFVEAARRGETLQLDWDGRQSRDFIAVQDIARANLLAARKAKSGEVYNVASGQTHSLLALIRLIEQAAGHRIPRVLRPKRLGDVRKSAADISKIMRLGFRPKITLKTGILRLWEQANLLPKK